MRSVVALVTIAIFGCIGCASANDEVSIDPAATAEQREAIAQAIRDWNKVTNREIKVRDDADCKILFVPEVSDRRAAYSTSKCEIVIRNDLSAIETRRNAAHEIGHMIGILEHHMKPGVMSYAEPTSDIREADLELCRKVGACD